MGKRTSYDAAFKLKVITKAVEMGSNRKAADFYGVNEKLIRGWRKVEDQLRGVQKTAKRCSGAGRPVKDTALDTQLVAWVKVIRSEGHAVSGPMLQLQAGGLSTGSFKASNGWLTSFKKRHALSTRQGTSIGQKLPKDSEEKVTRFQKFLIDQFDNHHYELCDVFNMDETPMKFDMVGSRTLETTGANTVLIRTNGAEKRGFTAILTVAADGTKLPPTVIFKGVRDPKVNVPGCHVFVQRKGYIDEPGCLAWVARTFPVQNSGRRRLLVWDSCRVHLTQAVREALAVRDIDVAVIPGGLSTNPSSSEYVGSGRTG